MVNEIMPSNAIFSISVGTTYIFDLEDLCDDDVAWLTNKWPEYFPNSDPSDYPRFFKTIGEDTKWCRFKLRKTAATEVALRFSLIIQPTLAENSRLEDLEEAARLLLLT